MSPEQRALVRESWRRFEPTLKSAGAGFYQRLFALDPVLERLFADSDMVAQEQKLMAMFAEIVRVLDQEDELVAEVAELGRRHVQYGVKDADYESVGAALLWTLEQGLGDAFSPDVRSAWTEAYLLVATVMRRAAARTSRPVDAPW
jgi:hemoglobin-like flavoprotein